VGRVVDRPPGVHLFAIDVTNRWTAGSEPIPHRSATAPGPKQRQQAGLTTLSIAVLFPGQGTQQAGMGAPWRDHPAWSVVEEAEAALGEPLGWLVTDAPTEVLSRTREAQLAVLLTSLVAWTALEPLPETPVAFAGHSLGQVTALIAAGALPLAEGVRFAARRAELTQAAADAHPGRMAALLGAAIEQAEESCTVAPGSCWIANDNAPGQVVIAGTPEGVESAGAAAQALGVRRVTPLNVGGAFHTPLMLDASLGLAERLADVTLLTPGAPVVSNHDGQPYADAEGWRDRLSDHVSVPVRWRATMTTLVELGADTFLEVGHGSMLAALAKRGAPEVTIHNVAVPEDVALEVA
jgi:[acyl-carrier-protein] S-malonyltransferase